MPSEFMKRHEKAGQLKPWISHTISITEVIRILEHCCWCATVGLRASMGMCHQKCLSRDLKTRDRADTRKIK